MTNEELDDAVAVEALRICEERPMGLKFRELAQTAARLAREGWTPPEPVDPDLLAVREIAAASNAENAEHHNAFLRGDVDGRMVWAVEFYKAGREQEQERAKVLVKTLDEIGRNGSFVASIQARSALAAYKAGRAAR